MKLLTFLLTGPIQSWGDSSRWDNRSTASMPGKSAIVGLLGCCLGYPRGDGRLEELGKKLQIAVRADRSGQPFWDYQTVQRLNGKILNSKGKGRSETIITQKQYLQDAAFQVFIKAEEDVLKECYEAMCDPHWVPFLGRRNCVPARPIMPMIVEYSSLLDAAQNYFDPHFRSRDKFMPCQIEGENVAGGRILNRFDEVIRADMNIYERRIVTQVTVKRRDERCI